MRRQVSEDGEEEDYSMEEMRMMHETDANHDESDHEMSIVDDNDNNATTKEWHINLFGEIVHDEPEHDLVVEASELEDVGILNVQSPGGNPINISAHGVSELLFHPANFKSTTDPIEPTVEPVDMKQVICLVPMPSALRIFFQRQKKKSLTKS